MNDRFNKEETRGATLSLSIKSSIKNAVSVMAQRHKTSLSNIVEIILLQDLELQEVMKGLEEESE